MKCILPLVNSGGKQWLTLINDDEGGSIVTEKITFDNLDIYVTVAPNDLIAYNKNGVSIKVKEGDIIIKSHCRGILYSVKPDVSFKEVMDIAKKQYENSYKEEEVKKELYPCTANKIGLQESN